MDIAVGYVRVSTTKQAKEGESLSTQKEAINSYAKSQGLKIIKIYADEGISGGTVSKRPALRRLLLDAGQSTFKTILVHRLSRLGRNARELLNNLEILRKDSVSVVFLKENIDLSNPYGQFMLTMLAAMAELEKDISGEASIENKIALAKQGIPSTGKYPFGRKFNKKTDEWYYHPPEIRNIVEGIADRFLMGEGLRDIADTIPVQYQLSYSNILKVFHKLCGPTWEVKFKREKEPVLFDVPPLLSAEKIKAVQRRLEFNRTFTKANRKRHTFLLTGFVWCMECGRALTAQHQKPTNRKGKSYSYNFYRHPAGKREECRALTSIRTNVIESAVMNAIWENLDDEGSDFHSAWESNYPDKKKIKQLKDNLKKNRKSLKSACSERDTLVEAFLKKVLSEDAISSKNAALDLKIASLNQSISKDQDILKSLPSAEEVANQERMLKRAFKDYYYSRERFETMSFEEKRSLLFSVFDGVDEEGKKLGVYVKRISKFREMPARFEFYINARFFAGYLDSDNFSSNNNNSSGSGSGDPEHFSTNSGRNEWKRDNSSFSGFCHCREVGEVIEMSMYCDKHLAGISYKSSRRQENIINQTDHFIFNVFTTLYRKCVSKVLPALLSA